ncbi:MAG: PIG-L deacetylase family protein, partial [Chloroflexota bacterium]
RGFKDIASLRAGELECAADHLGLQGVFFLDYRDSGMTGSEDNGHPNAQVNHPVEEVAGRVVKYIRELKPDIVLTFDPIGGYKHPDHIHIHKATKLAFEMANDPWFHPEAGTPFAPRALYYQVIPRGLFKLAVRLMPLFGQDPTRWGRNKDINIKELAEVDFPVHVRLDIRSVAEVKREAAACHASQGGGVQMQRGWMRFFTKILGEREEYMRAYPKVEGKWKRVGDLFEGI